MAGKVPASAGTGAPAGPLPTSGAPVPNRQPVKANGKPNGRPNNGRSRPAEQPAEQQPAEQPTEPQPDEQQPAEQSTTVISNGAGFILALLVWGWVVLPFIKGGPKQAKATFMAKFLNRAPDGSWLP